MFFRVDDWLIIYFKLFNIAKGCLGMVSNIMFDISGCSQSSTLFGTLDPLFIARIQSKYKTTPNSFQNIIFGKSENPASWFVWKDCVPNPLNIWNDVFVSVSFKKNRNFGNLKTLKWFKGAQSHHRRKKSGYCIFKTW